MPRERKRSRRSGTSDFLATPMYRLVDRHRAILEKIKTREDAEHWGHMLIGKYYPDIPSSRAASGKLAALVGLTDYMDFYCASGYYELLKEGKTLEEARRILGERAARGIKELTRHLGSKKPPVSRQRPLSDSAGILGPKAREALRQAIEEAREERKRLDMGQLRRFTAALERPEDAAVLESVSRKVKSAGLTRKKAQELLGEVKKEQWNRRRGRYTARK